MFVDVPTEDVLVVCVLSLFFHYFFHFHPLGPISYQYIVFNTLTLFNFKIFYIHPSHRFRWTMMRTVQMAVVAKLSMHHLTFITMDEEA